MNYQQQPMHLDHNMKHQSYISVKVLILNFSLQISLRGSQFWDLSLPSWMVSDAE